MTFESIYNDLVTSSDWLLNQFFRSFISFINSNPLIVTAVLVSFCVPALIYILYIYRDISSSVEGLSFSHADKMIMRVKKYDFKIKRDIQKQRQEAIEAQRFARGRLRGSSANKYVNAYMNSLKNDNK